MAAPPVFYRIRYTGGGAPVERQPQAPKRRPRETKRFLYDYGTETVYFA